MLRTSLFVARLFCASVSLLMLPGCVEGDDFGSSGGSGGFGGSGGSGGFVGSGGSNAGSLSLARDVCLRSARKQRMNVARVDKVQEYAFGNNPPRGVKVVMQMRRDAMSVNTEPRVCRFSYANGTADIART